MHIAPQQRAEIKSEYTIYNVSSDDICIYEKHATAWSEKLERILGIPFNSDETRKLMQVLRRSNGWPSVGKTPTQAELF